MVSESGNGGMTRLVIFDHIDSRFQGLFMYRGGEWGRVIEAHENTDIQELVFRNTQVRHDAPLRRESERGSGRREVQRGNQFVYTRIEQCVGRSEYSMNVRLWMTL